MIHGNRTKTRKFGRVRKVRNGLLRSLSRALVLEGRIKTSDAKARTLRPLAEKMISLGKKNTLASHRELVTRIGKDGAQKIIKDLAPKYSDRRGGYSRITKLPQRASDGSFMAVIEFI